MTDAEVATWLNGMSQESIKGRDLDQAHGEAVRELTVRNRCFPRWVEEGRITKMDAKDRLERLEAAVWFLEQLIAYRRWCSNIPVTSSGDKTAAMP